MANIKSSKKRARQSEKRRIRNLAHRSKFKTCLKKVILAVDSGNKADAQSQFKAAQPIIDKMVSKGLIHKNKAARHKSRLSAKIKALAS